MTTDVRCASCSHLLIEHLDDGTGCCATTYCECKAFSSRMTPVIASNVVEADTDPGDKEQP